MMVAMGDLFIASLFAEFITGNAMPQAIRVIDETEINSAVSNHAALVNGVHGLTTNISAALSGAASPSAGNVFATLADVSRGGLPYKVYTSTLSQDGGETNPTANVLYNTLGFTPAWVRSAQGQYVTAGVGHYPIAKTWCVQPAVNGRAQVIDENHAEIAWIEDAVILFVYDSGGGLIDGFNNLSVEIRVYP